MHRAIDFDAYSTAILGDGDDGVGGAVEIFAYAARQFAFNSSSQRFADIHLPPGDLYAHQEPPGLQSNTRALGTGLRPLERSRSLSSRGKPVAGRGQRGAHAKACGWRHVHQPRARSLRRNERFPHLAAATPGAYLNGGDSMTRQQSVKATVSEAAPSEWLDLTAIVVCTLCWGTTWFAITLQLGVVDPVVSVVYRFAFAALVLFAWCALRGERIALTRAQHFAAFGVGFSTFTINYSLVYLAEQWVTSAVVA